MSRELDFEISPAMREAMAENLAAPVPGTSALQDAYKKMQWDKWYASLPMDLQRKLSIHDFKRLGDLFTKVFHVRA